MSRQPVCLLTLFSRLIKPSFRLFIWYIWIFGISVWQSGLFVWWSRCSAWMSKFSAWRCTQVFLPVLTVSTIWISRPSVWLSKQSVWLYALSFSSLNHPTALAIRLAFLAVHLVIWTVYMITQIVYFAICNACFRT